MCAFGGGVSTFTFLIVCHMLTWAVGTDALAAEPKVITNTIGMKLVEIPAGEFMMGAERERADILARFPYCNPKWLDCERPSHTVRITKPFFMGQHEVTLDQFLAFYHDANYVVEIEHDEVTAWGFNEKGRPIESGDFRPWSPVAWTPDRDHPATFISWNDAAAFCAWLSKKEGKTYRLPTEAEWEYACRAGSRREYHFGDNAEELTRFGNAADANRQAFLPNALIALYDDEGKKTETRSPFPYLSRPDGHVWIAPVGKFNPNAFGLYDMHGNVWEWCADRYGKDYYATSPTDDPEGPSEGTSRVLRGGGFDNTPLFLRSPFRNSREPSFCSYSTGFRVVRVR